MFEWLHTAMPRKTIILNQLKKETRLDRALRDCLPNVGRKTINQLIGDKQVQVNGKTVWLNSWKVKNGDTLTLLRLPDALPSTPQIFDASWVIADDGDLIAMNKPAGLLSQETKYGKQANLLSMMRETFGRVTLFHRLDRDTSGVVLFTRGGAINRYLDTAFKNRTIIKNYVAMVSVPNNLAESGIINARLAQHPSQKNRMVVVERGGKEAITEYRTGAIQGNRQVVYLTPKTGRTHQLRVHLQQCGAAILGDRLYSDNHQDYERLYLHAHTITLPADGDYPQRSYTAPLPSEFGVSD